MNNKKKKVHKYKRANLFEDGGQLTEEQKAQRTASQIQDLISGAGNLTTSISNNLSVPNTQSPAIQAGTKEDLFSAWGNYNPVKLGRSNNVGSSVSSGLSGASAGLSFGPVGAAVGGGVGLIGGLVSSIFGNKKRERRERQLNYENQRNFGAMADTLNAQDIDMQASNYFKKGGNIHIKKKNRGKFTEYCGGKVTSACIQKGLHSSNPTTRKRANFARNARGWKHDDGGFLSSYTNPSSLEEVIGKGVLQVLDPTGISSYPDAVLSISNFVENPSLENLSDMGINIFSALPIVGKVTAPAKIAKIVGKAKALEKARRLGQKASNINKKIDTLPELFWPTRKLTERVQDFTSKYVSQPIFEKYMSKNKIERAKQLTNANILIDMGNSANSVSDIYQTIDEGLNLPFANNYTTRDSLNTPNRGKEFLNMKAEGGSLSSNSDNFTNGVTMFENGGTHEENPNMGILQGYDQNGIPNLVEEGEVKYNDYIYSNRLKPSKNLLIQANLNSKKYEGQTYAQIAKDINKESEERPNDPISKRGLSTNMSRLQLAQELQRAQTEQDNMQQANIGQDGMYLNVRPRTPSRREIEQDYIDLGGAQPTADNFNTLYDLGLNAMPAPQLIDQATAEKIQSDNFNANQPQNPKLGRAQQYSSYLRYVPALGAAVGVATDALGLTNKPNYSSAERMEKLRVTPTPIGNYLTYRPFDRNYYINQLNSNAGATRRALQNASAGNRATYAAGLLSADYNQGIQLGQLARQAEEYNLAQRQAVEQFNRGTNMANAEMDMRAQQMNNDYIQRAAALRDNARMASSQARSVNLSNLFNSLGDIGREQATRNMILTNPASPYYMTADGRIVYKGTK